MNADLIIANVETGRQERLNVIKENGNGLYIACSTRTGNIILVQKVEDGYLRGAVDVARHIEPHQIQDVVEFLKEKSDKDNTQMESALSYMLRAFLERLICRLGEMDQPLLTWMYEHRELLLPELPAAWEAVKANHELRDVNRKIFDIERAEKAVQRIMTA